MKKRALFVLMQIVLVLFFLECLLLLGLNYPTYVRAFSPPFVVTYLRELYAYYDQRIIQYEPEAAHWDKELFYSLKPGRFVFSNREFSTPFFVNSAGTRDAEEKIDAPEIVIVGDSFAMGWGVGQDEHMGALMEKKIGKNILNVAVSSYGTARELLLLKRIDTSKLKTLLIQFSQNDVGENASFVESGYKLITQDKRAYEEACYGYKKGHRYHFGRYALKTVNRLLGELKNLIPTAQADASDWDVHASNFAKLIQFYQKNILRNVRIIFFMPDETPEEMLLALNRKKIKNFKTVSLRNVLDRQKHYFILDDHLNQEGHRAVAEAIAPHIP